MFLLCPFISVCTPELISFLYNTLTNAPSSYQHTPLTFSFPTSPHGVILSLDTCLPSKVVQVPILPSVLPNVLGGSSFSCLQSYSHCPLINLKPVSHFFQMSSWQHSTSGYEILLGSRYLMLWLALNILSMFESVGREGPGKMIQEGGKEEQT